MPDIVLKSDARGVHEACCSIYQFGACHGLARLWRAVSDTPSKVNVEMKYHGSDCPWRLDIRRRSAKAISRESSTRGLLYKEAFNRQVDTSSRTSTFRIQKIRGGFGQVPLPLSAQSITTLSIHPRNRSSMQGNCLSSSNLSI
jgi:hypothetical protein